MAEIIPAILTNDVSDFRKKHAELLALSHQFMRLHVDFIDGEFLPNRTLMPQDLSFLKTPFILMAHFMTKNPQEYFAAVKKIGFSHVLFHWEAFENKDKIKFVLKEAQNLKLKSGLVINPETKVYETAKYLNDFDLVQVMGIHPGAQGRNFEPSTIEKIKELKNLMKDAIISVDGGIKTGIARQCVEAGADYIVAGSYIFHSDHPKTAIEELKRDLEI